MESLRELALEDGKPDDFVQSVGRALRVLEVVSASPGLPVKAIARRCELNLSTTYHLVRTLAYEGYLDRLPDGTYVAGAEVARRFHDLVAAMGRPRSTTTVLRHLMLRTGLSAYLGRISGGLVVVAAVEEGPGSPYLEDFETGLDVSAHATALGKVLLASMPRKQRRSFLLAQGMRRFTARTRTDLDQLDAELGVHVPGEPVVEHGEYRDGVACAASLVPQGTCDQPRWALVVSVHGDDVSGAVRRELTLASHDLTGVAG